MPPCSIYLHDPGPRYNVEPMHQPGQLWANPDHWWGVAHHLHQALSAADGIQDGRIRTTKDPEKADVIFVAHYFLTDNHAKAPLHFGGALNDWDSALEAGPAALLGNGTLLRHWQQRSADFVVAPLLLACQWIRRGSWLRGARWLVLDPFFRNACRYRHGFDIMTPYVVSTPEWAPHPRSVETSPEPSLRRRHFLLYAGRLGKPYLAPPNTLIRHRLWSALRFHPNATMLATDHSEVVAPFVTAPDERSGCEVCARGGCQHCLDVPLDANMSVGAFDRTGSAADMDMAGGHEGGVAKAVGGSGGGGVAHGATEYRALMASATFCLVLRGDTPSTRKFSEAVLAGCVPVLIGDLPAWPFESRLRLADYSYEFDWRAAIVDPLAVVEHLLRVPPAELAAKQRALRRVRRHFFFGAAAAASKTGQTSRVSSAAVASPAALVGTVQSLLHEVCTRPTATEGPHGKYPTIEQVYEARPKMDMGVDWRQTPLEAYRMAGAEMLKPAAWSESHPQWRAGFCGQTDLRSDCENDDSGSFKLPESVSGNWSLAMRACERRCEACKRCTVVSVSLLAHDCDWHHSCDLDKLRHGGGAPPFRSFAVKAVAPSSPLLGQGGTAAAWHAGHCGVTRDGDEGDCNSGDSGSWQLARKLRSSWQRASHSCVRRCERCARCRFVSLQYGECSWYATCGGRADLQGLFNRPPGVRSIMISKPERAESLA